MTVHLDISQLVQDPRRTGIQRAERELIRYWPNRAPLVPCRFDGRTRRLHVLPHSILDALCADAPEGGVTAELARLLRHSRHGRPVPLDGVRLLNAELFFDEARAGFYRALAQGGGCQVSWLVYDFLPWLDPEWFGAGSARRMMPYLRALRTVPRLAFISHKTRADYAGRIVRRPGVDVGPVIPMGGDGLGLERQTFAAGRRDFVMLGSIEPRKNSAPVMRAFQRLWRDGADVGLTLIGGVAPDKLEELALLRQLDGHPRFRHLRDLPDAGVRDALRRARAMLFPSEGEGFGIPPIEALHAGIPVVVSARLPAIEGLPASGQIRLDRIDPDTIAAAVLRLGDDAEAARLWADAATLTVPTWRDFAHSAADWAEGD